MEYNAIIREYSGKSLKVLARVLVADLKDYPADWKVRYCGKEIDKETTSVHELCCCPTNPLQIYKPAKNDFPIKVHTIDGKMFEVFASADDTIKVLKLKIFQANPAYPPQVQDLRVNRNNSEYVLFFDSFKLNRFAISSWSSSVYLKVKHSALKNLEAGLKFEAINREATYYPRNTGNHASPKWAQYTAGFNFCGLCSNPDCPSKDFGRECEVVTRSVPFGDVKINFRSSEIDALVCTACSKEDPCPTLRGELLDLSDSSSSNFQIVPKSFMLLNARSLIFYKKSGDDKVTRTIYSNKINKEAGYKKVAAGNKLDLLEITTVERWRSPFCCVRCDTNILYKEHEFRLFCGHVYHMWCLPSVLKGLKCKVCHSKILIVGKIGDILKVV